MRYTCSMLRRLAVGAAALIIITSLTAALACLRQASPVEPYVWLENPFGSSSDASLSWHCLISSLFAFAACLCYLQYNLRVLRLVISAAMGLAAILACKDAAVFYNLLATGRIGSTLPVPLSLYIALMAGTLAVLVVQIKPVFTSKWVMALECVGGLAGMALMVLLHLVTFGSTNYARDADAAVVLGAKVYSDGTPSTSLADRLATAVELYKSHRVHYLLMSGGTGVEGCNEALAMRDYAIAAGVPEQCILVDTLGQNTAASARNCRSILNGQGLGSVLIVSHYFHLARCKMLFAEQGISCTTVPAHMSQRLRAEPFFVMRECAAYVAYSVAKPWRSRGD